VEVTFDILSKKTLGEVEEMIGGKLQFANISGTHVTLNFRGQYSSEERQWMHYSMTLHVRNPNNSWVDKRVLDLRITAGSDWRENVLYYTCEDRELLPDYRWAQVRPVANNWERNAQRVKPKYLPTIRLANREFRMTLVDFATKVRRHKRQRNVEYGHVAFDRAGYDRSRFK
jgi:hypothetical protein